MYLKIHDNPSGKIVAVCDEDLIGKVLENKDIYMDLDKYRSFYIGESVDEKKIKDALVSFGSANIVGTQSVAIALSMGLATKKDVMYIKKTPYIQIYQL